MSIVPHRFLNRYSFPVLSVAKPGTKGNVPPKLAARHVLPDLGELDDVRSFAEIRVGWNADGLAIAAHVAGKSHPLSVKSDAPTESDGLQIWIDTRNTQSIHRASRFCHHFCLLPGGAGSKGDQPMAVALPIARSRDEMPLPDPSQISVAVQHSKTEYQLEAWLPAHVLHGFDPEANPLLGFYYYLRDAELGEQFLTVGRDFPFAHDPSLWSTLELVQ